MALTVSATDTEVQKPVNVIYERMLLENARPLCPYFLGTQPGQIQENGGTATVKWRQYTTDIDPTPTSGTAISPSTTALSEITGNAAYGQGRTPATVSFRDVTATVAKYGQFFILNEEVDVFLPNGTMAGITRTLGITAGRSLNQLQRNVAEDNPTVVYAGNVASDGVVQSVITTGALNLVINTLSKNNAMPFAPMSMGSQNVGTNPILPGFWALCHPDVAYDVSQLSGFKSVETYAGQVDTVPGEFGTYGVAGYTCRFVQSSDASQETGAGGSVTSLDLNATSGSIDLYPTVIYGQDAFGSVGLGQSHGDGIFRGGDDKSTIKMIAKGRGTNNPSGTDDPFDEIMTLAYKVWHTGALLNSNWARVIRSAATNLAN